MPKFKGEREKYYQVLSIEKKWMHGAFPYSDRGYLDAQKYQKKLEKNCKDTIIIVEG